MEAGYLRGLTQPSSWQDWRGCLRAWVPLRVYGLSLSTRENVPSTSSHSVLQLLMFWSFCATLPFSWGKSRHGCIWPRKFFPKTKGFNRSLHNCHCPTCIVSMSSYHSGYSGPQLPRIRVRAHRAGCRTLLHCEMRCWVSGVGFRVQGFRCLGT